MKENAKDSKNEAKTEETVSEVKAPETEVKSEESEVKEAEKKQILPIKKSEDKPVDLKKEQLDVDKKFLVLILRMLQKILMAVLILHFQKKLKNNIVLHWKRILQDVVITIDVVASVQQEQILLRTLIMNSRR